MAHFTSIDLIVVLAYMVGIAGLGIYQAVKVKSSGDYYAGGRKFSKWLMIMHALGTGTHADDPVGVTGAAYMRGISGIWYTFVYLFVTPFYWIIAPLFRRSRFITTADFFKARFGGKLAMLYAVMGILTFAINMGTLLKGTGTLADSVAGINEIGAIIGMCVIFIAYGFAGGLIATVVTESIQGVLIVVMSLLLVPFGLSKIGGFSGLHELVSADKFSLSAPLEMTIPWIVAGSVLSLIGIVAQPHTMEVCSTGKTEFEGRVGFTFGNFVKRFCAMGWAFTGVVVLAMVAAGHLDGSLLAGDRENAFGLAIVYLLPIGFTGLMLAAILAAQMSTLSAFMVAASALLTRNVYKEHVNPAATDRQILRLGRWVGLAIVFLGFLISQFLTGVAEGVLVFLTVSTFTGVFMWGGVLWRRANATGAWISFAVMVGIWLAIGPVGARFIAPLAGSLSGLFVFDSTFLGMFAEKKDLQHLVMTFLPPGIIALIVGSLAADRAASRAHVFGWAGAASAAALIAIPFFRGIAPSMGGQALITGSLVIGAGLLALVLGHAFPHMPDKKKLDDFYLLLKTPVGREEELHKAGVDIVYAGHSEGHPWELKYPRLVNIGGFVAALLFAGVILLLLYWLAGIGA